MGIKEVVPDAPGAASGKLIYVCEICRAETMRLHKGPELRNAIERVRL
jgi:hypothetical protein